MRQKQTERDRNGQTDRQSCVETGKPTRRGRETQTDGQIDWRTTDTSTE